MGTWNWRHYSTSRLMDPPLALASSSNSSSSSRIGSRRSIGVGRENGDIQEAGSQREKESRQAPLRSAPCSSTSEPGGCAAHHHQRRHLTIVIPENPQAVLNQQDLAQATGSNPGCFSTRRLCSRTWREWSLGQVGLAAYNRECIWDANAARTTRHYSPPQYLRAQSAS